MSLIRPVLRACAVAALRDRTWAEDRVYDSDNTPLAEALLGKELAQPYITVYTDLDDRTPVGTQMYKGGEPDDGGRQITITLEIGVASAIRRDDNSITLRFAATDQGMELAVDVIESQAIAALFGDPQSGFGDIFKRMVIRVLRAPSRRGGRADRGVRYAARQTQFRCTTIEDVAPGVRIPDNHPIRKFITLAQDTDLGVVDYGQLFDKLINVDQAPEWRVAQAYLGMTTENVKLMGIGPINDDETEPPLESIEFQ